MMTRYAFALFLVVSLSWTGSAQDIHFSQFYMSPLNLNPAMTGVMNCNQRFVANFRNQWSSVLRSNAYNTFSASYDQKIPFARYDYFGVGGTLWGDVAGASRFGTVGGNISGSYSKYLGGNRDFSHYAVLGAEVGFRQRSMRNLAELQFGDQFNPATGLINDVSAEAANAFFNNNFTFFDVNAGFLYFAVWNEVNSFWIGGALHHINEPNQSFFSSVGGNNPGIFALNSRYTLHGGAEISLNRKFDILPGFVMLRQGEAFELNAGAAFRTVLSKSRYSYQAFQFGVWTRLANSVGDGIPDDDGVIAANAILNDAIILSTRFDYDRFGIGFSYDVNVSSLRAASNGNGAFEFSLIYNICEQERRNVYCPKF